MVLSNVTVARTVLAAGYGERRLYSQGTTLTAAALPECFQTWKTQVLGGKIVKYCDRTVHVFVLLSLKAQCTTVAAFAEVISANKGSERVARLSLAKRRRERLP